MPYLLAHPILAAAEMTVWVLAGLQFVFNVMVGLAMFWLKRKSTEADDLKSAVKNRDRTIRETAKEMVDQRLVGITEMLQRIEQRLDVGEKRFEQLNQMDHKAEIALLREVHHVRDYMHEQCAKNSTVEALSKQLSAMREDLIRVQETKGTA